MSELDVSHLLLMQECLVGAEPPFADPDALSAKLVTLRDMVEWHDVAWDQEFTQAIAALDSATHLTDEQRHAMGDHDDHLILGALNRLRALVSRALVPKPEPNATHLHFSSWKVE